ALPARNLGAYSSASSDPGTNSTRTGCRSRRRPSRWSRNSTARFAVLRSNSPSPSRAYTWVRIDGAIPSRTFNPSESATTSTRISGGPNASLLPAERPRSWGRWDWQYWDLIRDGEALQHAARGGG